MASPGVGTLQRGLYQRELNSWVCDTGDPRYLSEFRMVERKKIILEKHQDEEQERASVQQ